MATIIPAILEENFENFESKLSQILKIPDVSTIQVDFSDGEFAPHKTLSIAELELLNPAYTWEAHLMVKDPRAYFFDAKLLGFSKIIFHYEALQNKNDLPALAEEISELKMTPVLAFEAETDPEQALPYLNIFGNFLILAVHPGYQAQEILPQTINHLKNLRNHVKNAIIEVDGGVKIENIQELYNAGADNFVVGSALFEGNTPAQNFEKLIQEIKT